MTTARNCSVTLDKKWVTIMGRNGENDAVFCVGWAVARKLQPSHECRLCPPLSWHVVEDEPLGVHRCSECFSMAGSSPRGIKTALQHSCNDFQQLCFTFVTLFWELQAYIDFPSVLNTVKLHGVKKKLLLFSNFLLDLISCWNLNFSLSVMNPLFVSFCASHH